MHFIVPLLILTFSLTVSASFSTSSSASSRVRTRLEAARSRALGVVQQLTLAEKISLVHGAPGQYVGNTPSIPRLQIPPIHLQDGPQGAGDGLLFVTQFPNVLAIVSTFDPSLMHDFARAMASEQYQKGTNVLLGPMVNLARVPLSGRNFESMGEDPYLASQMAAANVRGIQSSLYVDDENDQQESVANAPMIACVKHFLLNNQEYNRTSVSVTIDERVLRELYLPAFEAAIEAGVGSVMCSYNRINDVYACENDWMNKFLKQELNFTGWVMSDWYATHSTVDAALAGLDQQMPDGQYFGTALENAVQQGTVPLARLNDMVTRILTSMIAAGVMGEAAGEDLQVRLRDHSKVLSINASSTEHSILTRRLAEASVVMLKNERNVLPLDNTQLRQIAVIGDQLTTGGIGSGMVIPPYVVKPFDAITKRAALRPSTPNSCTYEADVEYNQLPGKLLPLQTADETECCAACADNSACKFFSYHAANGMCWLKETSEGRTTRAGMISGSCYNFTYGAPPIVTYTDLSSTDKAVAAAKEADVAILFIAIESSEGIDRKDLGLGSKVEALISAVASNQPRTIVVLRTPGAVTMPWLSGVPSLLLQWYGGQEAGNAITAVLFGDVNPSARLPITFPNSWDEQWLKTPIQYPGIKDETVYSEGMLMGYRHYDANGLNPLFGFGAGLSFTSFEYANAQAKVVDVDEGVVRVSVEVTNIGGRAGAEVVQLYLTYPSSANEPPKVLRGFQRVYIFVKETRTVNFDIVRRGTSIWDTTSNGWLPITGQFKVLLGASSVDIRTSVTFSL